MIVLYPTYQPGANFKAIALSAGLRDQPPQPLECDWVIDREEKVYLAHMPRTITITKSTSLTTNNSQSYCQIYGVLSLKCFLYSIIMKPLFY
jgi:hypothetical protein